LGEFLKIMILLLTKSWEQFLFNED